jgi:hypothetical protein
MSLATGPLEGRVTLATPGLIESIDALLAFLPMAEARLSPGQWTGGDRRPDGVITMPAFSPAGWLLRFHRAAYANGWVRPGFHWSSWYEHTGRAYEDPARVQRASVDTICRLLTAHIRADRFIEGNLGEVVSSGMLGHILRRLAVIRERLVTTR